MADANDALGETKALGRMIENVIRVLNRVKIIDDQVGKTALIDQLLSSPQPTILAFVNAHGVNMMWSDEKILQAFDQADVLLRDGKGLELFYTGANRLAGLNMNGTDFIPEILESARGARVAVCGTAEPWLSKAVKVLGDQGHNIIFTVDGFLDPEEYGAQLKSVDPTIILLAMGMPKQEIVAQMIKSHFTDTTVLIVCGGAIIDFIAGRQARAPQYLRDAGLEWAFRLFLEPRRLFRRYVIGNILYLYRVRKMLKEII